MHAFFTIWLPLFQCCLDQGIVCDHGIEKKRCALAYPNRQWQPHITAGARSEQRYIELNAFWIGLDVLDGFE